MRSAPPTAPRPSRRRSTPASGVDVAPGAVAQQRASALRRGVVMQPHSLLVRLARVAGSRLQPLARSASSPPLRSSLQQQRVLARWVRWLQQVRW
jgi:hypothetical protein